MARFDYIAYKTDALNRDATIAKLVRFEEIDKYRSFYKILPAVVQTTEDERATVTGILNSSTKELIALLNENEKPHKASLKKIINDCMKRISLAEVSNINKDFAYELCWYLSDIAGLDMRKNSHTASWGYWDVVLNEVKVIEYKKPKVINKKR